MGPDAALVSHVREAGRHRPQRGAPLPSLRARFFPTSALAAAVLAALPLAPVWADSPIRLGHEFVVSSYTAYTEDVELRPDVASAPGGEFVVVWELASSYIFGQRYDALGTKKGGEFLVSPDTGTSVNHPSVAMAGDGGFVVVWEAYPTSVGYGYGILGQRYSSAGARVGDSFTVNTTPDTYYHSSVATWPDGGFVVAWANTGGTDYYYGPFGDGDEIGILAQRFDTTGAPIGNEFVVNTYTTGYQDDPAVAAAADGSFVVVWADSSQDYYEELIVGQRYDSAGAPQGGEFVINTTPCGYCIPSVAAGTDGRFVVVWDSMSGRRFDSAGTAQGGEFVIPSTPGAHGFADVTMASDGSFVVAWLSGTGFFNLDDVRARRFDSAGAPQDGDFQVNENLGADSYLGSIPAVSGPGDGTFVVTWLSPGDLGTYIAGARIGVGSVGCAPEPLTTCREPTAEKRGAFRFRDSTNDARDSLSWRWAKGEATSAPELGDPFSGTA